MTVKGDMERLSSSEDCRHDQGETRRGVPIDYSGDDPSLCNARTQSGRPCRALGLYPSGRCKWHGGMSTGPKTPEGKARSAKNFSWERKKLRYSVGKEVERIRSRR
jgi:hypothetical protein